MLIGKPLPGFSLPGQPPGQGFSSADVIAAGRPALVNFFASWCIPCVQEAPVLMTLKQQGTPIWGIAYKDKTDATRRVPAQNGDPYTRIARDEPGTRGDRLRPVRRAGDLSGGPRRHRALALGRRRCPTTSCAQSLAPLLQSLA